MRLPGLKRPEWLAERRCAACREPFLPWGTDAAGRLLCGRCAGMLKTREAGYCPYCGEIFAFEEAPCTPCGACMQKLPPWSEFLFYGVHEGLLRELIVQAKFGGSLPLRHLLGCLIAGRCTAHYGVTLRPDAIVPMPLYPARLRERGYSQCREICRPVEKALGVPVRQELLEKILPTPEQARLGREERKKLGRVFRGAPQAAGMRILLVDDVCTTGTTLRRAAEALLAAGAARVDVAVLARTPAHGVGPA